MHDRIKQIIENEGLSVRKFEEKIHCSTGVIAKALKNGTDISSKFLISIKEIFPHYSAEWLLTGEGEMFVNKSVNKKEGKTEKCKQPNDMEEKMDAEKERFYRRLEEMEKREESRDFVLRDIRDALMEIKKELKDLHEHQEEDRHTQMCG